MRKTLFLTLAFLGMVSAQNVLFLNFTTVNVDSAIADSLVARLGENFKNFGYEVFFADTVCREIPCAGEMARQKHTAFTVFGSIMGMGEQIVVTAYLIRSDDQVEGKYRLSIDRPQQIGWAATQIFKAFFPQQKFEQKTYKSNTTESKARDK